MDQDIRWQQRLSNLKRAMLSLDEAVALNESRGLSKLERQGLIQGFEFTHELAWNCLKDYLSDQGEQNIHGSKDATRKAFSVGLIEDGEVWMGMIRSRNLSSHTYNEETALKIADAVALQYHPEFQRLIARLESIQREESE